MNLAFVWGLGAVLGGWIILRILGAEREQKLQELEANRPPQPTTLPASQTIEAAPVPAQRKAA